MKKTLPLLLVLFSLAVFSQKETNIWYFGYHAGIDFNSGSPVIIPGGADSTREGVASISNSAGQILFYSDGRNSFDKNHDTMPNGKNLLGHISSTQSSVIVSKPGSTNIFYLFTVGAQLGDGTQGGNNYGGVAYSEVDMTLRAGLGDITANKNIPLINPSLEKLTAIKGCNDSSVWVICQKYNSPDICAYHVTSTGVNTTPVISSVGSVINGTSESTIGYCKASPNGKRFAMIHFRDDKIDLFDFNTTTGVASNKISWAFPLSFGYGLEFSPNGSLLYASSSQFGPGVVVQYNLNAGSPALIQSTAVYLSSLQFLGGALQAAPDGKIYLTTFANQGRYLNAITSPNTLGVGCNYVVQALDLGKNGRATLGLPNFNQSYFNPPLSAVIINKSDVTCGANGTATVEANGGSGIYSYAWAPTGGTGSTATNLNIGTYTVTIIDPGEAGCITAPLSKTTTVTIGQASSLIASVANVSSSCGNGNGQVSVTPNSAGAYTFNWQPGGATSQTVSNVGAGTYTVTVTDGGGCTSTSTTVVAGSPAVNVSLLNTVFPNCNGGVGSISVNATGGTGTLTYNWTGLVSSTATANNISAGSYTITVTDGVGCTATTSANITEPSVIIPNIAKTDATCGLTNGSINTNATGGAGNYTYNWNNGDSLATALNLDAGTYFVTISDNDGCTVTASATLINAAPLVGTLTALTPNCSGQNSTLEVNLTGGDGNYTYTWSNGLTGAGPHTVSPTTTTNYSLTVTDGKGCTANFSVTINVNVPLGINVTANTTTVCQGASATISANASGGNGNYTYAWQPSGLGNSFVATPLSTITYTVTVNDDCGTIASTATIAINVNTLPTVLLQTNNATCGIANGTIVSTVNGGVGNYNYSWSNGDSVFTATVLDAGTYTVTVVDQAGCVTTASSTITNTIPVLATLLGSATICIGQSTTLTASVSGGNGVYTYSWSNGLVGAGPHVVSPVTTTPFDLVVNDGAGCMSSIQSVTVTVNNPLSINLTATNIAVCIGSSTTLTASVSGGSGNYNYTWLPAAGTGSSIIINPATNQTYTVTVSDDCGTPISTANIPINVNQLPTVDILSNKTSGCGYPLCVDFSEQTSSTCSSLLWNFGDNTTSSNTSPNHCYQSNGLFDVSLTCTDNNGCSSTKTISGMINVLIAPTANFNFNPSSIIIQETAVNFNNTSANTVSWTWDFNDIISGANNTSILNNPTHIFNDTGTYCVKLFAYASSGCVDSTTQCLSVNEKCVFPNDIPNVFSPNKDSINDLFYIKSKGLSLFNCNIYNRWGTRLNDFNLPKTGWNGTTYTGDIVPEGTYYYIINATCISGEKSERTGFVQLLR